MLQIDLSSSKIAFQNDTSIALGFFDGVHLAHREILQKTVEMARKNNLTPAVFSFFDENSFKNQSLRITSQEERLKMLDELGIEVVFLAHFQDIKDQSPMDFITKVLLSTCHAKYVLCGFNFRFGYKATGTVEFLTSTLKENGVESFISEPIYYKEEPISSSRIRDAIQRGMMEDASAMLGYPYHIQGVVYSGKQIGRTIGFPTANLICPNGLVLPSNGVYETKVVFAKTKESYIGITNVGERPTVDGHFLNCETFLLDYLGKDFYGETIEVNFARKIRDEMKFPSLDSLKEEIERNKQEVLKRHGK